MEKLLTVQEVADALGVPIKTVYEWRYRGQGPRGMKVGRYVRYRAGEVEKWLDQQGRRAS